MPSTTNAVTKRYYPALSEVIAIDDLPEFLHFAEDGLIYCWIRSIIKTSNIQKVIIVMHLSIA